MKKLVLYTSKLFVILLLVVSFVIIVAPGAVDAAPVTDCRPAMIQRPDEETDAVVRSPNNSLQFYFNPKNYNGWGSLPVTGAGSSY